MSTLKEDEYETLYWTKKQKEWFLRRDRKTCQFVDFSSGKAKNCYNQKNLHLHFILPPRFAAQLKIPQKEIISPFNGIILCEYHHLNFIHPDIGILARKLYRFTPESFQIILKWHEALAKEKVPYWITIWDEVLKLIAKIRTRNYLKNHPQDPFPV